MDKEIKIALVDDHALFRNGLRGLIDGKRNCRVVAEASDGAEFLESEAAMAADVVFMDIAMPTLSGDKATTMALERNPEMKVICLSMFGEEARLWEALSPTAYYRLAHVEGDPRPLSAVEKACDDLYMSLVREGARIPFGAPVAGGYLIGCETAVKNIRIVLAAKEAGLDTSVLRERVRLSYV